MKITIKLFAVAQQLAAQKEIVVEVADDARVADLRRALIERLPQLASVSRQLAFAVNTQYVADGEFVPASAEVAVIPPVSGG